MEVEPWFRSELTYEDLLETTNNFCEKNYIGPYHFGKIYRGSYYQGCSYFQPVIVKIWDTSSSVIRDNEMRVMREVNFLRNERVKCQPAAAKLLGCLFDGEHVAVMYDLNALDTLHSQLSNDDFHWEHRIKVALWFARLMKSIHSRNPLFEPFVIHDIDASLILLDVDYVPKLFNFDLMTGGGVFPKDPQRETESCKSAGERNDVFAFGLLLLSLISKRSIKKEEVKSIKKKEVTSQFGGSLLGNRVSMFSLVHATLECEPYFYATDGEEMSSLAMQCLSSSPDERPSMKQVARRLQKLQLVRNHGDLMEIKPPPGPDPLF